MPDNSGGEKSEQPTPRKLEEARNEGNVPKSSDLTAALSLLGAVLLLGWFGRSIFGAFRAMVQGMLGGDWAADVVRSGDAGRIVATLLYEAAMVAMPIAVGVALVALAANLGQVGILITFKPLVPKFSKLNPVKGFANLFSKRALMRFVMAMGKVAIVGAVAAVTIYLDGPKMLGLIRLDAAPLLGAAAGLVYDLAIRIAVVLLLLAIMDLIYQRWQHQEDLKMTKHEVKEEMKRMEGDPMTKQRRTRIARQLAMQRMAQAVPGADVVVTNPTHYAVALKYDESMAAPKVVAKGVDYMAMRIRQLAAANGVPIVERPPLARALNRHVEVGREIPVKYYSAVAEILAYVYQLDRARRRSA